MVLKKITYHAGYLVKADCTGLSSNTPSSLPRCIQPQRGDLSSAQAARPGNPPNNILEPCMGDINPSRRVSPTLESGCSPDGSGNQVNRPPCFLCCGHALAGTNSFTNTTLPRITACDKADLPLSPDRTQLDRNLAKLFVFSHFVSVHYLVLVRNERCNQRHSPGHDQNHVKRKIWSEEHGVGMAIFIV